MLVLTWGLVLPAGASPQCDHRPLTISYNAGDTDNYSWYKLGGFTFSLPSCKEISFILTSPCI